PVVVREEGPAMPEDWREATITITLNPKTAETVTVNALINAEGGQVQWIRLDADKDLSNGYFGRLDATEAARRVDLFFRESREESALNGVKRRAFARQVPDAAGRFGLYV